MERAKVGVVAIRDLLSVRNIDIRKTSSIISYIPRINSDVTLGTAVRVMAEHRLRSLPIVGDREIIGQVSARSLIERIGKSIQASKIMAESIMVPDPVTIARDTLATTASRLMKRRRIDHLPVTEGEDLFGILTSSHLVNSLLPSTSMKARGKWGSRRGGAMGAESARRLDYPADRLLETQVVRSTINHSLSRIVTDIVNSDSTYSMVTLNGQLQGIITFRDIIKLIADAEEIDDIPLSIMGLPADPLEAEVSRRKFHEVVGKLKRIFPDVLEAVGVIKTSDKGGRPRYEVKIKLVTARKVRSYEESGWELPSVYDRLSDRIKKVLSSKPSRKRAFVPRRRIDRA